MTEIVFERKIFSLFFLNRSKNLLDACDKIKISF